MKQVKLLRFVNFKFMILIILLNFSFFKGGETSENLIIKSIVSVNYLSGSISWSPNGNFIAVDNSNSDKIQVFGADVSGGLISEISSEPTDMNTFSLAWSPRGDFVAIVGYSSNTVKIFGVDTTGNLTKEISSQSTQEWP
ncbi:MAG: beta-propeller fold lactonase family protein, partial [Candidatus Babeliales bacterium]